MMGPCGCRHAISLDERRGKFQPEYVNGGAGPLPESLRLGRVKEVWFVGSHSDMYVILVLRRTSHVEHGTVAEAAIQRT